MRWIRIRAEFPRYAGGGPPPSFDITSDDDGFANVEIAIRPELLVAPVSSSRFEFFSSAAGCGQPSVAGAEVRIHNGRATYDLPEKLWVDLAGRTSVLWFRVVGSTQASGAPVFASHGDEDCLRGLAGAVEVLQLSAPVPADPIALPGAARALLAERHRRTLQGIVDVPGTADRRLLAEVLAHQAFVEAPTEQQAGVLDLFARSDSRGRGLIERLLDLGVQVGSNIVVPGLFMKDERGEATTLDHLLALHDATFHRRVRARRAQIVGEAIQELVDPGMEINQGNVGTCTATSVQAYTAVRNPAELARWLRHLFDARSRFRCELARGGFLRLNTRAFSASSWGQAFFDRTYTERVIQAALMDFGNFRRSYDPKTDEFVDADGTVTASGLWPFEVTHLLEQIFNQPFRWDFGGGSYESPNQVAAADRLLAHLQSGGLPVMLVTFWGAAPIGAHATLAVRAEGNTIVIRNPQYRGSVPVAPDGTALADPPRQVLRANRAEESVAIGDLRTWIIGYCMESGSTADFGYTATEIPGSLTKSVQPTA